MKERVTIIAQAEGQKTKSKNKDAVVVTENQIDAVLSVSGGDMRRAVTSLQSVQALLAGQGGNRIIIDEAAIYELAGLPSDQVIETLYESLLSNSFDTMQAAVRNVIADGYSVQTLLQKLLEKFAEAEDRMNGGADEYLQLMTVCGLALQCLFAASQKMKQ